MYKTGNQTSKQKNVMAQAGQQHALQRIVLAVAWTCENKNSFSRVDLCLRVTLQKNAAILAVQNYTLRRIVGVNVGQHASLQWTLGAKVAVKPSQNCP